MIGQQRNIARIKGVLEKNTSACFIIIGPKMMGKKTLVKSIVGETQVLQPANTMELRDWSLVLESSMDKALCFFDANEETFYRYSDIWCYMIDKGNRLPIFITTESAKWIPNTLLARATMITMAPYTQYEIEEATLSLSMKKDDGLILKYASSPGQVLKYRESDFESFFSSCKSLMDNLHKYVSIECFDKVYQTIGTLWTVDMFLDLMLKLLNEKSRTLIKQVAPEIQINLCGKLIIRTREAMCDLSLAKTNYHQEAILDSWILDYRRLIREYGQE